jgi:hypothetical protein
MMMTLNSHSLAIRHAMIRSNEPRRDVLKRRDVVDYHSSNAAPPAVAMHNLSRLRQVLRVGSKHSDSVQRATLAAASSSLPLKCDDQGRPFSQ